MEVLLWVLFGGLVLWLFIRELDKDSDNRRRKVQSAYRILEQRFWDTTDPELRRALDLLKDAAEPGEPGEPGVMPR